MDYFDQFLTKHSDIEFVRFEWLDCFGQTRCRVLTKAFALELKRTQYRKIAVQPASSWLPIVGTPDRAPPLAVVTLYLDWSFVKAYSCYPGHVSVLCCMHESLDDLGFRRCPRTLLGHYVNRAFQEHGVQVLIGFEIEFVLIEPSIDQSAPAPNIPS